MKIDYEDPNTPDVVNRFDRLGRNIQTGQGKDYTKSMAYDDLGRVVTETVTQPGVQTHTLTRAYNNAGKPSGFHWQKGNDTQNVSYTYDPSGRLSAVSNAHHGVTYEYLANSGQIQHINHQTQGQQKMRTTRTYDRLGRLLETGTRRQPDKVLINAYRYGYNLANQRVRVETGEGETWEYHYDRLGQVVAGDQYDGNGQHVQKQTYDYDSIDN